MPDQDYILSFTLSSCTHEGGFIFCIVENRQIIVQSPFLNSLSINVNLTLSPYGVMAVKIPQ